MSETKWMLVEKLAPSHKKITGEMMQSDEPIPPVKTEKVWVEGEVVHQTDESVTIDTGEEQFTTDPEVAFDHIPSNARRKMEPLE